MFKLIGNNVQKYSIHANFDALQLSLSDNFFMHKWLVKARKSTTQLLTNVSAYVTDVKKSFCIKSLIKKKFIINNRHFFSIRNANLLKLWSDKLNFLYFYYYLKYDNKNMIYNNKGKAVNSIFNNKLNTFLKKYKLPVFVERSGPRNYKFFFNDVKHHAFTNVLNKYHIFLGRMKFFKDYYFFIYKLSFFIISLYKSFFLIFFKNKNLNAFKFLFVDFFHVFIVFLMTEI